MWHNYFDKIYVVNLPDRVDRYIDVHRLMLDNSIPFEIFPAIKNVNGAKGLNQTMRALFKDALKHNYRRILVFEDDVVFLTNINDLMTKCCTQLLSINWQLFYLGINSVRPLERFVSDNIIKVPGCYASHAVCYNSQQVMENIIKKIDAFENTPYDLILFRNFSQAAYCSYPMIASQKEGYSDIEKKNVSYTKRLTDRFELLSNKIIAGRNTLSPKQS